MKYKKRKRTGAQASLLAMSAIARKHFLSSFDDIASRDARAPVLRNIRIILTFGLIFFVCLNIACESPSLKANKTAMNKTVENKVDNFQSDLQTMRTAGFDHIFVFRRKDGGVFDAEDKTYLKDNSPAVTNRFILSDDDKAVIAGSGFEFPAENLETLRQRFNVEDYSQPKKPE